MKRNTTIWFHLKIYINNKDSNFIMLFLKQLFSLYYFINIEYVFSQSYVLIAINIQFMEINNEKLEWQIKSLEKPKLVQCNMKIYFA